MRQTIEFDVKQGFGIQSNHIGLMPGYNLELEGKILKMHIRNFWKIQRHFPFLHRQSIRMLDEVKPIAIYLVKDSDSGTERKQ